MRLQVQGFNLLDTKKIEVWHEALINKVYATLPEYRRLENLTVQVEAKTTPDCAGIAKLDHFLIQISPFVLANNTWFKETYAHELAHMLSSHFYQKNTGHGPRWQELMKIMHIPANTYHNFR